MNVINKLIYFLDPSLRLHTYILIFLLILNAFAESLTIALIIPIIIFLFDEKLASTYPDLISYIEFFSPLKYMSNDYNNQAIVISGLLSVFSILIILRIIFNILFLYFKSDLQLKTRFLITKKLLGGYFNIPHDKFSNKNNSKFAFSTLTETQHISDSLGQLFILFAEIFLLICIFFVLLIFKTKITIFLTILVGTSSLIFLLLFKKKINLLALERKDGEEINHRQIYEMFDGYLEIKSYNSITFFLKKYSTNLKKYLVNLKFLGILPGLPKLWLEFISLVSIIFLLSYMILNNFTLEIIISTLGLYVGAVFRVMPSIGRIIIAIQNIKYFEPTFNGIQEDYKLIDENKIFYENKNKKYKMFSSIELSNISYGYKKNELILKDLSFKINKNEKIGIAGQSGCGKSTLIKVIAGLIKPYSGKFILDNEKSIENDYLNLINISFVPQNIFIVNDTIRKNIALGADDKDIDDKKVKKCIEIVQLQDVINKIDNGINYLLLEGGKNLSGGQIQRLGIARALYNEPDIIIFDESTSSLDSENESKILKLIEKISQNKTIIFVSHRKEVLNFCDTTYVLEDKKIIKS